MAQIFISYATPDRAVADEVSRWLREAGHEPFLDHELRDGISVGEDWKQRLYRELREVDAVIGVVTSSFVASNWCSAELGIADALGCRLMPVRAEAGVVHPLMPDLQYADYQADPQAARERVLQAVRLLHDGGGAWREGENPFPGLEPFTSALSRVFFGRAAESREVANRLRAMGSGGGMLAIVGPSGCGKSSLLNAAVVPLLGSDPAWLMVPTLVPGTDPLPELARALAVTAARLELDWSASEVRSRLEADPDGLRRVADDLLAADRCTQHQRLLVTVDQAEEFFTRTTPAVTARFAQLLNAAVTGPVQVVAAMRSEFLDDLRMLPALATIRIEADVLAPLDREVLRDVIEQPAKVARLSLDDGLAAALVADTGGGEALPLLAFTLRRLADGLPAGGRLSLSRYRDLGGVQGALAQHADAALAEAVRGSGLTEREVLAGLTRLVTVDDTGRRSRRRIRLVGSSEPLRVAFQVFVDRRLLVNNTDDGQVWLAVAHEALLTEWRPLDGATADLTIALRAARVVEQAAAEWNTAGRPANYLWDDKRLTTTQTTLGMVGNGNPMTQPIVELDGEARDFLDATSEHVQARQKLRRRLNTVLTILAVLAVIAAGVAVWQRQSAISAQHTIIAQGMVAQADRIRDRDPRAALQLGIAARQFDASPQTQASLDQSLVSTAHFRTLRGHTGSVFRVAFAPDGRTLATASKDRTVRLWDVSNRDRPRLLGQPLTGHTDELSDVAFAPDGRTLATGSADKTAILWDLSDRERPRRLGLPLTGHESAVSVKFAPDGRTLATGSQAAILWDLSDREQPRRLGQPLDTGEVWGMAFAPDGRTLAASVGYGYTVTLWDVGDRDRPRLLPQALTGHNGRVHGVAFAPDGRTLATTSTDMRVRLWDVGDRDRPVLLGQPLTGHDGFVYGVAFAPDGRTLVTTGADRTIRLWDVGDRYQPFELGRPLIGHTDVVNAVVFAPDGRTLATASRDRTATLWELSQRREPRKLAPPLIGHTGTVRKVIFAPDGRTLATASDDRTVRLWDVSDRDRPRQLGQPLIGHTNAVFDVAFASDGRTLATASDDVRLWDLTDRNQPRPLGQPLTGIGSAVFSPDGRTLATASVGASALPTVTLWDVSDRDRPRQLGQPLIGHVGAIVQVLFVRDGRTLVTASLDQTVGTWDVSDRDRPQQLSQPLSGHTGSISNVALSRDGLALATTSADKTAIVWDLSDRAKPRQLGQPLTGHSNPVSGVAFTPDGRTLATVGFDLRLWDLSDRDQPRQIGEPLRTGHPTPGMWTMAFAPDGHTVATVGVDRTVVLWDMPSFDRFSGNPVQEACIRAGGPLDEAAWDRYAPGVGYQDTCANR